MRAAARSTRRPTPPRATPSCAALLFYDLLAHGIYTMPKRGFMALSLPLAEADFAALEGALDEFLSTRASLLA